MQSNTPLSKSAASMLLQLKVCKSDSEPGTSVDPLASRTQVSLSIHNYPAYSSHVFFNTRNTI